MIWSPSKRMAREMPRANAMCTHSTSKLASNVCAIIGLNQYTRRIGDSHTSR